MTSSKVDYDAAAVSLESYTGSSWTALHASSITFRQGYEVSEAGVLQVGPDTLDLSISLWADETIGVLEAGDKVRLSYDGTQLFEGLVSDVRVGYSADPAAAGSGHAWRADYSVTASSVAAARLAVVKHWLTLPAESISSRLGRWLDVDLGTAPDRLLPPETSSGSTSLLEIVRAASDYAGRPLRLVDTGSSTTVEAVSTTLALPSGFDDDDALGMYTRAAVGKVAGERSISFDPSDIALEVTADLVADDVRVLVSDFQIPGILPRPFGDPARVKSISWTFSPEHAAGSVEFHFGSSHGTSYRPPAPYIPGHSPSSIGFGGTPLTPLDGYDPGTPDEDGPAFVVAFVTGGSETGPLTASVTNYGSGGGTINCTIETVENPGDTYTITITEPTSPSGGYSYLSLLRQCSSGYYVTLWSASVNCDGSVFTYTYDPSADPCSTGGHGTPTGDPYFTESPGTPGDPGSPVLSWPFISTGPAVPTALVDDDEMTLLGYDADPPALASFLLATTGTLHTVSQTGGDVVASHTQAGTYGTADNDLATGAGTAARTVDVHAGDRVFAFAASASETSFTPPAITSSDPVSLPLAADPEGIYTGTAQADGAYVISANGDTGDTSTVALAVVVTGP